METKIQKPRVRRSTHKMSDQTITTSDIFDIQPVLSRMIIPHDSFNIELNQLNRCSPLPYSSFVKIKNRMAAFFVKYSQIWKPFDSFISQTPYAFFDSSWDNINTIPTELPYVTPLDLMRLLRFKGLSSSISLAATSYTDIQTYIDNHSYDFYQVTYSGPDTVQSLIGFTLTAAGRVVYKTLYSLGYRIPLVSTDGSKSWDDSTNTFIQDMQNIHMSLLPLIAYLSVRINYYTPVKYRDYKYMNSLVYLINPWPNHVSSVWAYPSTSNVDFGLLAFIVETIINTYYGEDYFTSNLVNVQKTTNFIETNSPMISTTNNLGMWMNGSGSVLLGANGAMVTGSGFDIYLLNALKNQTSFSQLSALTQNDVVGAVTAKLGYKPEQADMVPFLLSHDNSFIKVSPILQSADTSENYLGYKAGTADGTLHMKNQFNFDTFGHLLYVSSISPDVMYYQGVKRELQLTTPNLHYNPMNTNVGIQATGKSEISIDLDSDILEDSFGFREKYAELGSSQDILSGDFVIPTRNATLYAMHFGRNFFFNRLPGSNKVANNLEFQLGRHFYHDSTWTVVSLTIANQYDRIFVNEDETEEHIEQWNLFDITATRSIAPSGDYTIGDDNNGDVVENTGIAKVENN